MSRKHRFAFAAVLFTLVAAPIAARALTAQNPFAERPGKEHELLKSLTGKWNATFQLTVPGAPPTKSKATEVGEQLSGLWVVSRYDDPDMLGSAFAGVQLLGYDPAKKKYVGTWVDSQTASMTVQEGVYDEASKTLTLLSDGLDPMTGQQATVKSVIHWSDADHRSVSMLAPGADGKDFEIFHIDYERAK